MAELDIEALKRLAGVAYQDPDEFWIPRDLADRVIAALEDRDRLRAAAKLAVECYQIVQDALLIDTESAPRSYLADGTHFVAAMEVLRAALERRDGA